MQSWKRFLMGEVVVDWGDGDADELQDRVKRSMNSIPHADGEKRSGAIEAKSEEPKIDMYSEGSVASEGIETEYPHVGGRKEIEQIEDDALVASQGGYTRSKSSTGPQEFKERQTFKTGEPNVGVSAANPCEEQVEEAPREERLLNGSVTKSGEPTDENSIEGSFMQGAGAGPKIEYFCAPNQDLTSDTWKIFFYHMLPFTTLPPLFMLACLWWAYREWGWSALLFCTTISALLSVSTPIYSRKFREYVSDYFYGLLARYVPRAQYVVPEKPFPEDRPYIFACHPHGRMFYSTIIFCQLHSIWRKNILQKGDLFMTAAGMFFFVPLLRNLFYLVGVIPVEEADIVAKLKHKDHVTILIGGVKEVLLGTEDDTDRLYLKRRKGFCRIAVQQNAGVVPVYFFNENQMFMHNSKSFLRFWERVNKYVKVGVPFMRGRFLILPMPFRRPLMIAVGDPLFPREEESVNDFHERYMKALRELFDRYVPYSPNPNTKLVIQ